MDEFCHVRWSREKSLTSFWHLWLSPSSIPRLLFFSLSVCNGLVIVHITEASQFLTALSFHLTPFLTCRLYFSDFLWSKSSLAQTSTNINLNHSSMTATRSLTCGLQWCSQPPTTVQTPAGRGRPWFKLHYCLNSSISFVIAGVTALPPLPNLISIFTGISSAFVMSIFSQVVMPIFLIFIDLPSANRKPALPFCLWIDWLIDWFQLFFHNWCVFF